MGYQSVYPMVTPSGDALNFTAASGAKIDPLPVVYGTWKSPAEGAASTKIPMMVGLIVSANVKWHLGNATVLHDGDAITAANGILHTPEAGMLYIMVGGYTHIHTFGTAGTELVSVVPLGT